jgi:hypothetical protein
MKHLLLVIGILLGVGGSSLYLWMKPQTGDPYFFLTPKSLSGSEPILIPIELYKKGASVDYVFWLTPLPQEKYFYLFPAGEPTTAISLSMEYKNIRDDNNISIYDIFRSELFPEIKDKTPLFYIELYKINNDLSESLIKKETKLFSSELYKNFFLFYIEKKYGYGQYRFKITVLWDRPEIKRDDSEYFIEISPRVYK